MASMSENDNRIHSAMPIMGFKKFLGDIADDIKDSIEEKKLERVQRKRDEDDIQSELDLEEENVEKLLNKFQIPQIKDFLMKYLNDTPEPRYEYDDETEKEHEVKPSRNDYIDFFWHHFNEDSINFEQLKDYALAKRIVARNYFGEKSDERKEKDDLSTILDVIQSNFEPESVSGQQPEDKLQSQLTVFLKATFPDKKIEREVYLSKLDDRVDIVIDDKFALELKVPKSRTSLRNLSAQIEEYLEEYDFLGVVIADVSQELEETEYDPMTKNINEYVERFKSKYNVQSVVIPITSKGSSN